MGTVSNVKLSQLRRAWNRVRPGNALRQVELVRDLCNAFLDDPFVEPKKPERRAKATPNRMEAGGLDRSA